MADQPPMMVRNAARRPAISIRYALPALLVTLIVVTVGLTGWLAFRSGREAVYGLATRLSREIAARIGEHARDFLDMPHTILRLNAASARSGDLDLDNLDNLARTFADQVQLSPSVPFLYFGSEEGEFVGVQREEDGGLVLWLLNDSTGGDLVIRHLGKGGEHGEVIDRVDFDPRERPWYQVALEAGGPTWSPIYPDIARPILIITPAQPVYDAQGDVRGVLAAEFSLAQISQFLGSLKMSASGRAFVIERSGEIVASSTEEPAFTVTEEGPERLVATQSSDPIVRDVSRRLFDQFDGFEGIGHNAQLSLRLDGARHFVHVAPLQDDWGLDWLVVVVMPEVDFMGPIYASVRSTLGLALLIVTVAVLLGALTARSIIRPILTLTDAAAAVEEERFEPDALQGILPRNDELGRLARVFDRMAREVAARKQRLREQVQQLRIEIDEIKRRQQVDQIVDSEFFQDLRARSRRMRHEEDADEDQDPESE
jgi:two-component system sensor histidine kinase ChiS